MAKRTFSVFGDSISTFEGATDPRNLIYYEGEMRDATGVREVTDTWWMQVIDHFDGELLANGAYSGCLVEGQGFPAASSIERAQQILGPNGEQPDVVLVFAGINDYGWGGAPAQASARCPRTPPATDLSLFPEREPGDATPASLAAFADEYGRMVENLREVAPDAEIWCVSLLPGRIEGSVEPTFCWQLRGISLADYNEAIRSAAQHDGCRSVDAAALGSDYETTDGTHPTMRGMQQIAAMVIAALEDDPKRVTADQELFPEHLQSARICEKDTCVGCSFARGTGAKWRCVCERHL